MISFRKYFCWTSSVCSVLILGCLTHSVFSIEDKYLVEYMDKRNSLLNGGTMIGTGSAISLDTEELAVDAFLVKLKASIIDSARVNSTLFPPNEHFFDVKDSVEKSKLFKLLQKLPKPGNLNLHLVGGIDTQWLVKNSTYRENCYICYDLNGTLFHFFPTIQASQNENTCLSGWKLLKDLRPNSGSAESGFDDELFASLTLHTPNPKQRYPNKGVVEKSLDKITRSVESLLTYRPVYTDGLKKMMLDLLHDNVHYFEVRHPKFNLYDIDGSVYNIDEVFNIIQETSDKFKSEHTDFYGAKIIYTINSPNSQLQVQNELKEYLRLKSSFPDLIVGFDIGVGHEFGGLSSIRGELLNARYHLDADMKYFFSTRRNNWLYTTDNELIDAILLNSSRIAGALALPAYPVFMEKVKERGIVIEINPISDQVLMFTEDMRDHPAAEMLSRNIPVVIGTDKGTLVGTKGLSFDYHVTLMGMSGEKMALKLLKQLCINSIQHSALSSGERKQLSDMWSKNWGRFIKAVIKEESLTVESEQSSTGGASKGVLRIHVIGLLLFVVMLDTPCLS